jgi:hypothetical protein
MTSEDWNIDDELPPDSLDRIRRALRDTNPQDQESSERALNAALDEFDYHHTTLRDRSTVTSLSKNRLRRRSTWLTAAAAAVFVVVAPVLILESGTDPEPSAKDADTPASLVSSSLEASVSDETAIASEAASADSADSVDTESGSPEASDQVSAAADSELSTMGRSIEDVYAYADSLSNRTTADLDHRCPRDPDWIADVTEVSSWGLVEIQLDPSRTVIRVLDPTTCELLAELER